MKKAAIGVAAAAAIAIVLSGCGKGMKVEGVPDTVATVNGSSISASEYLAQTSQRAGKEVLQGLIEQQIILDWAKQDGVSPTDAQITSQIETMKRDGIYERQVKMMGESGVKNQARLSQAMINIATKKFKAGDKELESAYNTMKTRYVHGPRKYIALLINPDKSKIEEAQKALKDGESFDTVVTKFTDSRMAMMGGPIETWVDDTQPGLPPQLTSAIKDTKKGEVSEMFELSQPKSPTQYCLLKVKDTQGKTDIKLKEVKDEVAGLVAMQKAQGDPSFQKELTKRKKDAKIKVNITGFESVAEAVKNPPQQPPMTMGR